MLFWKNFWTFVYSNSTQNTRYHLRMSPYDPSWWNTIRFDKKMNKVKTRKVKRKRKQNFCSLEKNWVLKTQIMNPKINLILMHISRHKKLSVSRIKLRKHWLTAYQNRTCNNNIQTISLGIRKYCIQLTMAANLLGTWLISYPTSLRTSTNTLGTTPMTTHTTYSRWMRCSNRGNTLSYGNNL